MPVMDFRVGLGACRRSLTQVAGVRLVGQRVDVEKATSRVLCLRNGSAKRRGLNVRDNHVGLVDGTGSLNGGTDSMPSVKASFRNSLARHGEVLLNADKIQ